MAKNSVRDFDATAANNTDIQSVNIAEGCAPSGINNAIRELMADMKDVSTGTIALESPQADSMTVTGDLTVGDGHTIGDDGSDNLTLTSSTNENIVIHSTKGFITFGKDASNEWFRTDDAGNLLVAKTSSATNTVGVEARNNGQLVATLDGGTAFIANRKTSDGDVIKVMKDGTTVGTIGVAAGSRFYIGGGDVGLRFAGDLNQIAPWNPSTNSISNNIIDLGELSVARFNDAYITNGVTTGSDQNEKQQIATLTIAEIAAAKRISNGFKTFKWNDAVEAKGDNARTHTGVIAQEVRTALEAEGLDAGDYAFFMSKTWWETQTEVPAVEAVEAQDAVLDDDGNIVTEAVEAVEAQDAYTRTDTYDTQADAPAGATERTRLGIRYPELLAFVGAATEQRLADIETRLTALEA